MVNTYITNHAEGYKATRLKLENEIPPIAHGEIQGKLDAQHQEAFAIFVKEEIKKMRVNARVNEYKNFLPKWEREKYTSLIESFFLEKHFNFRWTKNSILKTMRNTGEDVDDATVKQMVRIQMDERFSAYAKEKGIPIDDEKLKNRKSETIDLLSDDPDIETIVGIQSTGKNLLSAHDDFVAWADEMRVQKSAYVEEIEKYEYVEKREIRSTDTVLEVSESPEKLQKLAPGETLYFTNPWESSDTLYRAQREPDGEYTLSFGNTVIKDVPKAEMDVIINLNTIPVISTLLSTGSAIYRTILREYKLLCALGWAKPLENPPDGFIEFIFRRLNDAYIASNPSGDDISLLWKDISNLPSKERWRYISWVLSTDEWTRSQIIKKLERQKILVNGRLNLGIFPR
jgi:hypothetical protein